MSEFTLADLEAIEHWYILADGEFGPLDDADDLAAYEKVKKAIASLAAA